LGEITITIGDEYTLKNWLVLALSFLMQKNNTRLKKPALSG